MPKKIGGKRLSKKEHKVWRGAFEGSKGSARSPGAVATAQVKKMRKKRKRTKK